MRRKRKRSLKDVLRDMLGDRISESELNLVRRSFEIIGDVVVIDIPDEIIHLKEDIARAILQKHKHVKTILRKVGEVEGTFRVAKYEVVYGGKTETVVREHGCRFLVDPTKVYYSVKLSGERERVAKMVGEGERVLVMFAGVGPYAIVIAKNSKPSEVVGVELNPIAAEYFRKNVELNKVGEVVKVFEGDVRDVVPKLSGKFDRILMPAPNSAREFVPVVRGKIKEGGYIHYYTFESDNKRDLGNEVVKLFEKNGMKVEVVGVRKCGSFAPYVSRFVVDLLFSGDN